MIFAVAPVVLLWYGMTRCQELSCVGPMVNIVLEAPVVIVLLVLWKTRPRVIYPAMLVCSETAMTFATVRPDFDFSPQFMIIAIPAGLVAGWLASLLMARAGGR